MNTAVAIEETRDTMGQDARASGDAEESEAYYELFGMAEKKIGQVPADLVARHVLSICEGTDWSVQRAAMLAVIRRWSFAKRDQLRVAKRPRKRAVFGKYETARRGHNTRPYHTVLLDLNPIRASCDCPDFLRNSLGLCKHVLVVLDDIAKKPQKLKRGLHGCADFSDAYPAISWNPIRPFLGQGDWLARVRWNMPAKNAGLTTFTLTKARRAFELRNGDAAEVREDLLTHRDKRLKLAHDLLALAKPKKGPVSSDPALVQKLEDEIQELQRIRTGRLSNDRIHKSLKTMKRRLYSYQTEGIHRFLETGRLLLADDMGLGKTAQAIGACHVLWTARKVKRGLIVVPAGLKSQWKREWSQFCGTPIEVVDGSPAQRKEIYQKTRQGFLIANYEQVLRDLQLMYQWQPDIVVLDEAQRIKNWATKTSAYVKQLQPRYRLVLTGTPMENRLEELASILEWIDPFVLEPAWRLGPWHTSTVDGKREVGGARNLDTLRARLAPCMVRRVRQEVLKQLPPRTDTRVPVELTPAQEEEHQALDQSIASLLGRAKRRPLTHQEFLRLMSLLTMQRIICDGLALHQFEEMWPGIRDVEKPTTALLKSLSSPKLLELRELVSSLVVDQGRKVVIFSQWRRMLQLAQWAVNDILHSANVRSVFFTGQERPKRRTQNIIDLHDDPNTRILFATDAGGVGLNLQKAANACINLDLPWNPAVLEQRIGRIYRLGQEHPIEVFNLVSERGIEDRISDIVGNKQALFKGLFDGSSNEVAFDRAGTFLGRLEKIVEPVAVPVLSEEQEDRDEELQAAELVEKEDKEEKKSVVRPDQGALKLPVQRDEPNREIPSPVSQIVSAEQVTSLFSKLEIESTDDGSVTIKAPPDAALALASLFQGLAEKLQPIARA